MFLAKYPAECALLNCHNVFSKGKTQIMGVKLLDQASQRFFGKPENKNFHICAKHGRENMMDSQISSDGSRSNTVQTGIKGQQSEACKRSESLDKQKKFSPIKKGGYKQRYEQTKIEDNDLVRLLEEMDKMPLTDELPETNLKLPAPPGEKARPLNQGQTESCTLYAVGNAIVEGLDSQEVDVNLDEIIGGLKQACFVDIHDGNFVEEFDGCVVKNMIDRNTEKCGDVEVSINYDGEVKPKEGNMKRVLVYNHRPEDPTSAHCVFVAETKNLLKDRKCHICLNSWGDQEGVKCVEVNRPGNKLYAVKVKWTEV